MSLTGFSYSWRKIEVETQDIEKKRKKKIFA